MVANPTVQARTAALHELARRWHNGLETPISAVTIGAGIAAPGHTSGAVRGHLRMIGICLHRARRSGVLPGDAVALRQRTWALLHPPGAVPDEYTIADTRVPLGQVRAQRERDLAPRRAAR